MITLKEVLIGGIAGVVGTMAMPIALLHFPSSEDI
jgi:hypothetical protein